jgi:hypothetical protein
MAAPQKKWFFATTKQLVLQQMPELSEPFAKLAASLAGARFLGQPGKLLGPDADAAEEEEQLDEAGNPKPKAPRFSEAHRLAFTVSAVDHDTAVVPRGAFVASPTHHVAASPLFAGLAGAEAGALANYCHFRPAEHPSRAHALSKAGVVPASDFLDPCSEDKPSGVWSLRVDPGRGLAELRSLKWPGYFGCECRARGRARARARRRSWARRAASIARSHAPPHRPPPARPLAQPVAPRRPPRRHAEVRQRLLRRRHREQQPPVHALDAQKKGCKKTLTRLR